MGASSREAVGKRYDLALMQHAREKSWEALHGIRQFMRPGISEDQARIEAAEVFQQLGMERLWHRNIIRFGPGTLETFVPTPYPSIASEERGP